SNRLVVGADFGVLAQDRIYRLEHLAHAAFRHRAFDHHDQFRLVGRRAHESPGTVLGADADAVDGDEVADALARHLLACALRFFEMLHHGLDHLVFYLVGAMRRHCWRGPGLRQRVLEIRHALSRIPVEHVADRKCKYEAVIVTTSYGRSEKEMA